MSFWQLVVLSVLGVLSTVGMTATLGARLRSPERRLGRGERVLAAASAAIWMAVQLTIFSIVAWWGRLVIGALLVAYIWLTTMSQMWATASAAYVMRRTAETSGAGQEARS